MRGLRTSIWVSALLVAACGTSTPAIDSSAVVSEVLESVSPADGSEPGSTQAEPITTTTTTLPPGCRLVIEEDEYGFEIEVIVCGEEMGEPPEEDGDWLGSDAAEAVSDLLRQALIVQPHCGRLVSYLELRDLVQGAKREYREPLIEAIAALEEGSAHCNDDPDSWADAMTRAIAHLEEFLSAVAADAVGDPEQAGEDE